MSEVKKIATRESYGNALAELGAQYPDLIVSKKHIRKDILTAVLQNVTW